MNSSTVLAPAWDCSCNTPHQQSSVTKNNRLHQIKFINSALILLDADRNNILSVKSLLQHNLEWLWQRRPAKQKLINSKEHWNKYVNGDWPLSTRRPRCWTNRPAWGASVRGPRASQFVWFWASGAAKFPKMCDFLPWTPMNHCAKFDAASFIIGREIRNCTNTQTQTVTGISTPCLSACEDKKKTIKCQLNY